MLIAKHWNCPENLKKGPGSHFSGMLLSRKRLFSSLVCFDKESMILFLQLTIKSDLLNDRYFKSHLWRYHVTFKVREFSRCSTKLIHVCKNCHLHWIAGRINILCKNLKCIYFRFWVWFFLFFVIYRSSSFLC